MKFFRLDLLTLLISLFILSSCKKQGTVNLGVNDGNLIEGKLIDTSTIFIKTEREADAVASALTRTPLSYFKDPVFGLTESNVAMDLNLPGSGAYTLPTGTITVDSAVLILPYSSTGFYGDSLTTRFKANVYQLDERLLTNGSYNASKKWKSKNVLLGTQSFFPRTRDSVRVMQPIRGGKDSLMKFIPQVRVPLNTQFVRDILFNAPADQLSSNLVFRNRVNGLYVKLDPAQTGPGGTIMLSMDSAKVKIYIRVTETGGTTVDTSVVELPSLLRSAEITHNYAGTVIDAEINANTKTRQNFYLQGLLGLRAKITFPYLKDIITTVGSDIIINRAEVVISPQPGTTFPYEPLRSIMLYKLDLADQRVNIQDNLQTDPRSNPFFGGFYDTQKKEYRFLVTAYIQDLMKGKTVDYGTYIGPANNTGASYYGDVFPNPQLDGRTAAVGTDGSPYRIKLNIIYTKVNK